MPPSYLKNLSLSNWIITVTLQIYFFSYFKFKTHWKRHQSKKNELFQHKFSCMAKISIKSLEEKTSINSLVCTSIPFPYPLIWTPDSPHFSWQWTDNIDLHQQLALTQSRRGSARGRLLQNSRWIIKRNSPAVQTIIQLANEIKSYLQI